MRMLSALVAAAAVGVFCSPATAATRNVSITRTGFSPSSLTITAGDTVVWTNRDTADHQVLADDGSFASPILRPNRTYSFTFQNPGRITYRDALNRSLRATVTVREAPPSVTLAANQTAVDYGTLVTLSGVVSSKKAGESVTLFYRPYPQTSFLQRTVIMTTDGGAWSFVAQPRILTAYQASFRGALSAVVTVEVRPKITFRRVSGWFFVKVRGGRSFSGRAIQVQRLSRLGQWVTAKKVLLTSVNAARFKMTLPTGRSRLRIAMSVNQAGGGYLGAFSPMLVVLRTA